MTDRELSEFLLRACHDLRAGLRSIRAHTELMVRSGDTAQPCGSHEHLGFIADGAQRIDLLVEGLASYSIALQIEKGSFQPTRMDVMLRTVLTRLDNELRESGAEVSYDQLPQVAGDPDRLIQLMEHLLDNAVRHRGESPPRICIAAERRAGEWLFSVQDDGPGVEAAYLETIFRPFERLNRARSARPGLGLAICRAIVERHGGQIWAESSPGAGCTVLFTLPADSV